MVFSPLFNSKPIVIRHCFISRAEISLLKRMFRICPVDAEQC